MAIVLALPLLFDSVVARFDADAAAEDPPVDSVPQFFGWRERSKQPGVARRIVWIPGNDDNGDLGDVVGPKYPGKNSHTVGRPLATLAEVFTVYVEGEDPTDPENERAQYQIVRELFDAWYRACYLAAHGTFTIESSNWMKPERSERRYGATIRVVCVIEAMIPDHPLTSVDDTRAVVEVSELDHSETIESAPAP